MLGLYLHIPFCSAICNYCNFNRGLFDADLKARYVDALVAEIERGEVRVAQPFPPPLAQDSGELRRDSPKREEREGGRAA